ncbi:AMSH-like ubiquitin thioesterase 3 [Arachis ipaensis]|uniref:AMSH-like ubiquitin thioesterase 3 n=1 Tax=Arachis ipaensis TaxID=130454 RepID=UPI000A2B2B98|nr:AMSH-like ubiquitin thioesterase 3 [Arachis ipaensis]
MMEDFLRLASKNTRKNLETCGVLVGSLKNRIFHITTLIIPKQESTSDLCLTLNNEEEIFEVQDSLSLFPLGWIHTHPSQTCFMSSVDLHTHYSYQVIWHYYYSNSVTIHIVDFAGAVYTSLLLRLWKRKRNSCNNAR